MTRTEKFLQGFLRVIGTAGLLAIPFALMPHDWMDRIHRFLGMGELPAAPIVGYLARSASLFYALLGGLFWVLSYNLRQHLSVLMYIGWALLIFGALLFAFDISEGMPWWWVLAEGPFNILFATTILLLSRRLATDAPANE
jgi:hypothetical protein